MPQSYKRFFKKANLYYWFCGFYWCCWFYCHFRVERLL